jgi:hypothetical protein
MVNDILKPMGVKEDFISNGNIRYCHRTTGTREIYFISNRTGKLITDSCYFRDGTMKAELWDPLTGEIKTFASLVQNNKGTGLRITLEPYQSYFVVFYYPESEKLWKPSAPVNQKDKSEIYEIQGPWIVRFDTAWGGPERITFDTLADWTKRDEDGIKYYSGNATYSCEFNLPDSIDVKSGSDLYLDPGNVKNMARVILNGKDLGILWTHPMAVRINGAVKQKKNNLEIEVVNLWINRLIGDESKPWDGVENGRWPDWLVNAKPRTSGRYTFSTHRFYKEGDKLSPSGLIGPVRILK